MSLRDRRSLLKLRDLIKSITADYEKASNLRSGHRKPMPDLDETVTTLKLTMFLKCLWLFENGCEVVEDWVVAQSDLSEKVAVPWDSHMSVGGDMMSIEPVYKRFMTLPEDLAQKILLLGVPMADMGKYEVGALVHWCEGRMTLEQLRNSGRGN